MPDIIGSVRRSFVFRSSSGEDGGGFGGLVDKIGCSIRKSRIGIFPKPSAPALHPILKDSGPQIRWRKGELIGCGAFGQVYMGMNLDSGELIAVKQVSIASGSCSREKTQAHIRELEEEVKLLKNLSHPNIVRYLGTAREDDVLNIMLEFVPGGSISSLLGKFGSFPESVIRMYTKQLLQGLEYLHKNGIMHRDIKGANILVDNKGCIKLADFGASKKVVELATVNGAKSMKGTAYWMAPEVILQTGHSFSADIWSVGCTVIEMATGEPPWSQYQEVAALFHIGSTKSHPPIPEHLSIEAKDFLLKCLEKEPNLRSVASNLLQHPFVTGDYHESHPIFCSSNLENSGKRMATGTDQDKFINPVIERSTCTTLKDVSTVGDVRCSTVYPDKFSETGCFWGVRNCDEDDMCQIDDLDFGASAKFNSTFISHDINKSFNPMCEPTDEWSCKFDGSLELPTSGVNLPSSEMTPEEAAGHVDTTRNGENGFKFPCEPLTHDDDNEVIESKIRAFLDEKVLDLQKLQSPLYEEFYNTVNTTGHSSVAGSSHCKSVTNCLPPKSSPIKRVLNRRFSMAVDVVNTTHAGDTTKDASDASGMHDRALREIQPPHPSEWKELLVGAHKKSINLSASFSERQKKWKEELDEELQSKREMMRKGNAQRTSSPKDWFLNRHREPTRFAFPGN